MTDLDLFIFNGIAIAIGIASVIVSVYAIMRVRNILKVDESMLQRFVDSTPKLARTHSPSGSSEPTSMDAHQPV